MLAETDLHYAHYPFEVVADEKTLKLITRQVREICREKNPNYSRVKNKITKLATDEIIAYNCYLLAQNQIGPRRLGASAIIVALRPYFPEDFWEKEHKFVSNWVKNAIALPFDPPAASVHELYGKMY